MIRRGQSGLDDFFRNALEGHVEGHIFGRAIPY